MNLNNQNRKSNVKPNRLSLLKNFQKVDNVPLLSLKADDIEQLDKRNMEKSKSFDRLPIINGSPSIQKHMQGQNDRYENHPQNLNLDRNFDEGYKFYQDQNYKTKYNFKFNYLNHESPISLNNKLDRFCTEKDYISQQQESENKNKKTDLFQNFRRLKNVNDDYLFLGTNHDTSTQLLNKCLSHSQIPTASTLTLDSKNGMIGSGRIRMVKDIYQNMSEEEQPTKIDLSGNNLKYIELVPFIKSLRAKIIILNLSSNNLGIAGAKTIQQRFSESAFRITELNLQNCMLGDRGSCIILESIQSIKWLKILNLSDNQAGDQTANALAQLNPDGRLETLELYYNNLNGSNIKPFFNSLNSQTNLKTLDISWNNIGSTSESMNLLGEVLASNTTLKHLDISTNNITFKDSVSFNIQIKQNHSLIGLHMQGNECKLDMDCNIDNTQAKLGAILNRQATRMSDLAKTLDSRKVNKEFIRNCWICEKWQPYTFQISNLSSPVFLHTEFNEWKPFVMEEKKGFHELQVMCPPGNWKFFYTSELTKKHINMEQDILKSSPPFDITFVFDPKNPSKTTFEFKIIDQNTIEIVNDPNVDQQNNPPMKPRMLPIWEQTSASIKWSIPISIWAKWKQGEDELIIKCFNHDWELIKEKLPKALKENESEKKRVQDAIRPNYKQFFQIQKQYSSQDTVAGVWCISESRFQELFNGMNFLNDTFPMELIPILFRETVTSDKNPQGNNSPSNGCVRHQFMNMMIKSIGRRQKVDPKTNTISDCIGKFFEEYWEQMEAFNPQTWRNEFQLNERVDNFFKFNKDILENVFSKQKETKPGEKPQMTLEKFLIFIKEIGFVNQIDPNKGGLYFNESLELQVNEVTAMNHTKMRNSLEFQECITRMIHDSDISQETLSLILVNPNNQKELELGQKIHIFIYQISLIMKGKTDLNKIENGKKQAKENGLEFI